MDTLSLDLLMQLIRHQPWICFHEETHKTPYLPVREGCSIQIRIRCFSDSWPG